MELLIRARPRQPGSVWQSGLNECQLFVLDQRASDFEDFLQARVRRQRTPLLVILRDGIEFEEFEVFLGGTDDCAPDTQKTQAVFADQRQGLAGKSVFVFGHVVRAQFVGNL